MTSPNVLFANNATTTLGANLAAGGTSMTVASSTGFPSPTSPNYFYCTLIRASDSAIEIVKVTAVSGTTWTITRAQEGTTALAFVTGDKAELRLTNGGLTDIQFGRLLNVQVFTSNTTYTPTVGATAAVVEMVGGGGGGGGCGACSAGQIVISQSGCNGDYLKHYTNVSTISGQTITIGAGGTGGSNAPGAGGIGGNTSIGTILIAAGGNGGTVGTVTSATSLAQSGVPILSGTSTGGNIFSVGVSVSASAVIINNLIQGTSSPPTLLGLAGRAGSGAFTSSASGGSAKFGSSGSNGLVIIYEYA